MENKLTADRVIELLQLEPLHMEGGFFRRTYQCNDVLPQTSLPSRYKKAKAACTAIYYLLKQNTFSMLHRLPTDELFHFYLGDPVEMLKLHEDGNGRIVTLGAELEKGLQPQVIVPRGTWQGTRLVSGGTFALMGVTVAPGFDDEDFERGNRNELIQKFPDYKKMIEELTNA